MCIEICIGTCIEVCAGICHEICIKVCAGICHEICIEVCAGICHEICIEVCDEKATLSSGLQSGQLACYVQCVDSMLTLVIWS